MADPWARKHIPRRFGRWFPRTHFHWIYLRKFGLRHYLLDGCPMRSWDGAMARLERERESA